MSRKQIMGLLFFMWGMSSVVILPQTDRPWVERTLRKMVNRSGDAVQALTGAFIESQEEKKRVKEQKLRDLQSRLDAARAPAQILNAARRLVNLEPDRSLIARLEREIDEIKAEIRAADEAKNKAQENQIALAIEGGRSGFDLLKGHLNREAEIEKAVKVAAVEQVIKNESLPALLAHEANMHERTMAVTNRRLAYGVGSVFVGVPVLLAAYFGIRHYYQPRPTIIERDDTSIRTLWEKLRKVKIPQSHLDDLVLEKELEQKVKAKFVGIEHAIRQHLPLSNMMFYGPAGTGKTMAAQEFARYLSELGLAEHIIIRGPAFKRIANTNEAVDMLAAILRWAKKAAKTGKKPVVLVFDEAETLFADREQPEFASKLTSDLVTTMTSFLGSAISTEVMFILSTNFPNRIDKALRNRVAKVNRIRFTPPGQEQREELLKLYLEHNFIKNGFTISDAVHKDINLFAEKMSGLVGRDIQALTAQPLYQLISEGKTELTPALLHEAISDATQSEDLSAY